jgi:hypothetical protein
MYPNKIMHLFQGVFYREFKHANAINAENQSENSSPKIM